jgi:hypothetical protein
VKECIYGGYTFYPYMMCENRTMKLLKSVLSSEGGDEEECWRGLI